MGLISKNSSIWEDVAILFTYGYACYLKDSLTSPRSSQESKSSTSDCAKQESGSLSIKLVKESKHSNRDNDNSQNNNYSYQSPFRSPFCDAKICLNLDFCSCCNLSHLRSDKFGDFCNSFGDFRIVPEFTFLSWFWKLSRLFRRSHRSIIS